MAARESLLFDGLDLNSGASAAGYSAAVLTDAPALYWRLGEGVGVTTAADASGNARTGAIGSVVVMGQVGALAGDSDTAALLSASGDNNGLITSSYSPWGNGRTFEGWAYRNNSSTEDRIFSGTGASPPLLSVSSGSNDVTWDSDTVSGGGVVTWTNAWPGNAQWVHWAVICTGAGAVTAELFINGVSKGALATPQAFNVPGNFILGGVSGGTTALWGGLMDEIAIYTSALSAARILAHYNAGRTASGAFILQGYDVPPPNKRQEWAQGADIDGALLVRDPLFDNREITLRLRVAQQATMDLALTQISLISKKLEEAEQQPDGLALVWTPAGSVNSVTFYVLSGSIDGLPISLTGDDAGWFLRAPVITVKLICKPKWYGTPVTSSTTSSATPFVTMTIPSVGGDVPAEGRLLITDAATQDRRFAVWGLEQRYYDPATSLLVESDDLVTSGYTGFQTTRTGAYDVGGGNTVVRGTLTGQPTALCASGTLSHVGTYRVLARIWAGGTIGTQYVRLAWQEGDGPYRANSYAVPPARGTFSEVDLGLITVPPKQLGTQRWQGRIESYTTGTPGTDFLEIDFATLIPAAEGYGKARGEAVADTPTVMTSRDEFDQTAGSLTGKTAPVGGNWAGAGDTDDFTMDTTNHRAKRDALGDATNVGRDVLLGSAMTTMAVQVTTGGIAGDGWNGLQARHVDANNKLKVVVRGFITQVGIAVIKRKASTETTISPGDGILSAIPAIGSAGVGYYYLSSAGSYLTGPQVQMRIAVMADGSWFLWAAPLGSPLVFIDGGQDADLATGGTLASGKAGIYDEATGTIGRYYDNFSAWVPTIPTVLYSGRVAEIRSDGAIRQDSTGVYYGPMPAYRGARFLVPPAGDENRTSRLFVMARRNDIEVLPSGNVTDNLTVQTIVTPCGVVVPF
jgi:hypothetical protein